MIYIHICQHCQKSFESNKTPRKFCSHSCNTSFQNENRVWSQEMKDKLSQIRIEKGLSKGINNPNYQGKITKQKEIREKISKTKKDSGVHKGNKNVFFGIDRKGKNNTFYNKKHSKETKDIISKNKIQQYKDGIIKIQRINISKAEKEIKHFFDKNNIECITQFRIKGIQYIYDFFLPKYNLIIEYNGDYWHANPKIYQSGSIIKVQKLGEVIVDTIWERDKIKKELAEQQGYKIIYIWEKDYQLNKDILKKLNL